MKIITIFTPTYNRRNLLARLYESLKSQTNKDFIWMLIDDGSTDGTEDLVNQWKLENEFEIQYFYKKNEGMHSAHNWAYERIETEWNTCIDSDDKMPENAVEIINREILTINNENCYGLVGLDADFDGKILGKKIPENLKKVKMMDLARKHKVTGDKKLVFKTEILKKLPPYPIFNGEKLVPLSFKSFEAEAQGYYLIPKNEIYCLVEYQEDGSTNNMWRQYRLNPQGFAFMRLKKLNSKIGVKEQFRNAVHLGSSVLFTKNYRQLSQTKYPIIVLLSMPFSILLNLYNRYKTKNLS